MRSGPEGIGNHRSEEPGKGENKEGEKINGEEKKGVERRRKEEDIDKAAFLFLSFLNRDGRHHTHTHTLHIIFRSSLSQALITAGRSVPYLVCQILKLHTLAYAAQRNHTHTYTHVNLHCACVHVQPRELFFLMRASR